MGIKGRRKRLRERELRADAQDSQHDEMGNVGYHGNGEDADGGSEDVAMMADGVLQPPMDYNGGLRMKKTEFFNMQDMEYLDRIAEEHANRRTSHMRKRRREEDVEAAVAQTEELMQHHYETEDALQALFRRPNSGEMKGGEEGLLERRRRVGRGARFGHPLIGIDPQIVRGLEAEGFYRMTTIQERVIPYALEGYDLLGQAKTGSGKTLAFCVPVLHATLNLVHKRPNATYTLLLAPTKELCVQTHDVLKSICQHISNDVAAFSVQLITGGTKLTEERRLLVAGASIVVGTPGRVHDHVQHCAQWNLGRLRFLVLDEADRMLADGFQRDLDAIVQRLPKSRQTFLFSATNSKSVRELARLSLYRTPLFIATTDNAPIPVQMKTEHGTSDATAMNPASFPPYNSYADPFSDCEREEVSTSRESSSKPHHMGGDAEPIPSTLRQFCHITPVDKRLICLYVFVKRIARTSKAMVFCSTIASTTFHFQMMGSVGFHNEVMMLHGHMKHRQRVAAFKVFNEWKTGVLFCTDVAARGLDIPNVEWILQYDPPLDPTEYIHRIGRTARAGSVGNALLFLAPEEAGFVRYLSKFDITLEKYPMPAKIPPIQMKLEQVLQLDPIVAKSAVSAYRAHVGAYMNHLLRETFNIQRLNLAELARCFALTSLPSVSLPKNTAEGKRQEYVKGKLKSLNRRRLEAKKYYEAQKTKTQWTPDGHFVGAVPPKF
ncbi:putative ATP-dependent RNA helicase [Trypanosoma cruzi]|uniref:ATP-dependent RNA helicase n=2 Tax=Trypanosoma cruzi TaxID=5693 RepID=Q4D0E2_TRYCC|nr:ATP-dependent RNA helicase, putative [Trypanosoma cruzi]EAN85995.1 ATP-dependent RNA helicase, putative [Trypanosoma cruzi]PWV18833.1 putative ATP-dependent RNA helicase [Trypanosoma cruzi]RNC41794.1 putative ATP-dependent RNA helicase [Trypanosoma cruzi]|eukprot:XP_807846.1 ATP-dependent RNA helicase [Trypanosoma cruzi strain CL Brener]